MQTHTHLHFNGNCGEAFRFYAETRSAAGSCSP
jgi:hypothetical protein